MPTKEEIDVKRLQDWYSFRKLVFYFEHQLEEGEITESTYKSMMNVVEQFKPLLEE